MKQIQIYKLDISSYTHVHNTPNLKDAKPLAIPLHKQPHAHAPAVILMGIHGPYLSNANPERGAPSKAPTLIMKPRCPISTSLAPISK